MSKDLQVQKLKSLFECEITFNNGKRIMVILPCVGEDFNNIRINIELEFMAGNSIKDIKIGLLNDLVAFDFSGFNNTPLLYLISANAMCSRIIQNLKEQEELKLMDEKIKAVDSYLKKANFKILDKTDELLPKYVLWVKYDGEVVPELPLGFKRTFGLSGYNTYTCCLEVALNQIGELK